MATNVIDGELQPCGQEPVTGFYRDGCCNTGSDDLGVHTVCAQVTEEFLEFSARAGNDLTTPRPGFPGLQPGDCWCVCAPRWQEALIAGCACPVRLEATHIGALQHIDLEDLRSHALKP